MANRFSPSCCCDDCVTTVHEAPFAGFAVVDGTVDDSGPYTWPVEQEGPRQGSEFETSTATQRLTLDTGDELGPPPLTISGDAEAWYHMIELSGDVDLEWDGGTIEVRPSAGTVTAGGETVAILDDATPRHTRLVLYVTPAWYAVMVYRVRAVDIDGTASTRIGTTRSSIQQIDRDNTSAAKSATLTAAANGVRVYLWTVSDATVTVSGGYLYGDITGDCGRPIPPMLTEEAYQFQATGRAATAQPGGTYPTAFDVADSVITGRRTYDCGGPQVDEFSGPVAVTPAKLFFGSPTAWDTLDHIAGNWTIISAALVGPLVKEPAILSWDPPGGCNCGGVDQCAFQGSSAFSPSLRVVWPIPTPATPYPKLQLAARLEEDPVAVGMSPSDPVQSLTPFGPAGRAPATTQLIIDRTIPAELDGTEITEATIEWATR